MKNNSILAIRFAKRGRFRCLEQTLIRTRLHSRTHHLRHLAIGAIRNKRIGTSNHSSNPNGVQVFWGPFAQNRFHRYMRRTKLKPLETIIFTKQKRTPAGGMPRRFWQMHIGMITAHHSQIPTKLAGWMPPLWLKQIDTEFGISTKQKHFLNWVWMLINCPTVGNWMQYVSGSAFKKKVAGAQFCVDRSCVFFPHRTR